MSDLPRFIHLRTHSEYSLLEGALPLKKLVKTCAEKGYPAIAVTDSDNLFCALEFSVLASGLGVQPILGCQISVAYDPVAPGEKLRFPAPVVLLVQSETGYQNLLALNSCLYLPKDRPVPQVTFEELARHSEGLICLSGGADGPVGRLIQTNQMARARAMMEQLSSIYPDRLYVELQRHADTGGQMMEGERLTERAFVEMAYALDLPLVATNDAYFPDPDMYEAHDALLCISEGSYVDQSAPRRRLTPQHYLKSPEEMAALFADLPEALENTVEIARRCAYKAEKRPPILPRFAEDEVEELRRQAKEGLAERLKVIPHAAPVEEYEKRLEFELGIIEGMGFPGYFLIVADFIKWAKEQGIPVGPGRGSGAGSLVAYALTITDLDPLRYNLLFERFLNPERVSMPDFDIDFCMDRREEVIRYTQEKYGHDKVGQIITFGALLSKAAVRDVGRVLQLPYGQVDKLSKLIPVEGVKPVSVEKALADEPRLREAAKAEEVVNRLLTHASRIEGLLRNASTHAAGVVIGDRPLDQLVPLYRDPRSDMPATQFNMKWVEQAGLVKFDFLGLKTLTVIQNAVDLLKRRGVDLDINTIPLDDEATYKLYASARTVAVFQVESSGMMDALRRMKPTCIEDIVALVALYRPGPMENIPTYCEVKNGLKPLESIHPSIDFILEETQGIIVYQEQVMQIAQVMAGYSLGQADLLRRAMGKKKVEEMERQREVFMQGAEANGISAQQARPIFDLMETFARYGFNKSHSVAYALVAYQTAWLKAHYPAEFMAAVLSADLDKTDKIANLIEDCKAMGLEILPPDINRSVYRFRVEDDKIRYGLGAAKGVGAGAVETLVQARERLGGFDSLTTLCREVDLNRMNRRALETLIRAGACDEFNDNRALLMSALPDTLSEAERHQADRAAGQTSLFGGNDVASTSEVSEGPDLSRMKVRQWSARQRLRAEREALGLYFSGHPMDELREELSGFITTSLDKLDTRVSNNGENNGRGRNRGVEMTLAGLVMAIRRRSGKGAFVAIDDGTARLEVAVFEKLFQQVANRIITDEILVVRGRVEVDDFRGGFRMVADEVLEVDEARSRFAQRLEIDLDSVPSDFDQDLAAALHPYRQGETPIIVRYSNQQAQAVLKLGEDWHVAPSADLLAAIDGLKGIRGVRLRY